MDEVTNTASGMAAADCKELMVTLLIDFDSHFLFTVGDWWVTVANKRQQHGFLGGYCPVQLTNLKVDSLAFVAQQRKSSFRKTS